MLRLDSIIYRGCGAETVKNMPFRADQSQTGENSGQQCFVYPTDMDAVSDSTPYMPFKLLLSLTL